MLEIIAHRGYWIHSDDKNTFSAFSRALDNGFGIEIDLSDSGGELIVSHDIPGRNDQSVSDLVKLFQSRSTAAPMALNIKSDGLAILILDFLRMSGLENYFVFDMSTHYLDIGIRTYTRVSEEELQPVFLSASKGVWVDAFCSDWYGIDDIQKFIEIGKNISIVSPELHGRSYMELWAWIKDNDLHKNSMISICTDFPLQAREYFNA
jgi:hypothetical protein